VTYDSYGNPASATARSLTPPGALLRRPRVDLEAGLYYNRARYYDPELGRFISEDPLGFGSGEANLYRYVRNNPLLFRDPTGAEAVEYALLTQVSNWVYSRRS